LELPSVKYTVAFGVPIKSKTIEPPEHVEGFVVEKLAVVVITFTVAETIIGLFQTITP